jgi:transposase
LDRSTLANWVGGAVWWLEPLQARLAEHVFASPTLFADDTPMPVLDPGRGRTKTGRLWVYDRSSERRRSRPSAKLLYRRRGLPAMTRQWCGPDPLAALYFYSPDRRAERPAAYLANFSGIVQVDGYPGFEQLPTAGHIQLAACWAHARRKFYEVHEATASPIAAQALRRIAELYAIEASIRSHTADVRKGVRRAKSLPLVEAMKTWLERELNRVPPRGGVADAIRYALGRWSALCRFLDDGRVELDNNTVERSVRPIAMTWSFCTPVQVFGNIKVCLSESTRHERPFWLSAATTCSLARSAVRI